MATHAKKADSKADALADDVDVVAVVSRDVDGKPTARAGFVLQLPEDPTDDERAAAWNDGGKLPPVSQPVRYHPRGW